MTTKTVTIGLSEGLETRATAMLVQKACQFSSAIYVEAGNKKVNTKSIMGMMTLGLNKGEEVTIVANGEDEEAAIAEMEKFLTGK